MSEYCDFIVTKDSLKIDLRIFLFNVCSNYGGNIVKRKGPDPFCSPLYIDFDV